MKTRNLLTSTKTFELLNVLFDIFHLSIIFFFLFGWLFEAMRMAHLVLSFLILISWFGLGWFFGFGYCLVTDIQWKIKKGLKKDPPTELYVKYMIDKITGLDTKHSIVNAFTTYTFFGIFLFSTALFFL